MFEIPNVDKCISKAIKDGVFPGGVVLIAQAEDIVHYKSYGHGQTLPEKQELPVEKENIIFDLASLTKPLATATLAMVFIDLGEMSLDDSVSIYIDSFFTPEKSEIKIRHLLDHSSGLPAYNPYYKDLVKEEKSTGQRLIATEAGRQLIVSKAASEPLQYRPGTKQVYSDIGYIVLGAILEEVGGHRIDQIWRTEVCDPLDLDRISFNNILDREDKVIKFQSIDEQIYIVPTEKCSWRGGVLQGVVSDENAYAMGGMAGHAGLFGSADQVFELIKMLLRCYRKEDDFIPPSIVYEFLGPSNSSRTEKDKGTWRLGWDTPTSKASSSGSFFSKNSIGHLGFTGASIWVDLEKGITVILLTNRVHPNRDNNKIKSFRPKIHNLIMKEL